MSIPVTPERPVKKWRVMTFGILAALLALIFLVVFFGAPLLFAPWMVLDSSSPTYHAALHRWHDSVNAAFDAILIGGSLIGLVWRGQKRPLLAQFFLLGFFMFSLIQMVFRPEAVSVILPVVILGLFVLIYPAPRALLRLTPSGKWNLPLLILSVLALLLLAPDIWHNLSLQITDTTSEHAQNWHWAIAAAVDIAILLAGVMSATKRPGWKVLGSLTGLTLGYLGAAALLLPTQAGSWGIIGGALSGLGGLCYLAATLYEPRTRAMRPQATLSETVLSNS